MPKSKPLVKRNAPLDQSLIKSIKKSKGNKIKISKWGDLLAPEPSQDAPVPQDKFLSSLI